MLNWNPRDIATIVRDALQTYYDVQNNQTTPSTLIGELEQEAQAGLRAIQALVDDMARQRRIWLANGMSAKLAAPDADLGEAFSAERWAEIKAVFDAFGQWMETPIVIKAATEKDSAIAIPPLVIISRRGNPGWGVDAAAQEEQHG